MPVLPIHLNNVAGREKLLTDFLANDAGLLPFISSFPSISNILNHAEVKSKHLVNRKLIVEVLKEQYNGIQITPATAANIDSLNDDKTFTVVTGHQLCLFTGPAYFIYKITSAIALANKLNAEGSSNRFVPVYWLASEDHDSDEISSTVINGQKLSWDHSQRGAVGKFVTAGLSEAIDEFGKLTGNNETVQNWIRDAYSGTNNLSEATRKLVNHLFGKYGLVIFDGDDRRLKKEFSSVIREELGESVSEKLVNVQSQQLEKAGYEAALNPRAVNLFILGDGSRERLEKEYKSWRTVGGVKEFSSSEIDEMISETPEVFSPNVILRPLYQECLLPNVAYVGGPAEIAYWSQLKLVFDRFRIPFPVLVLRDSALVIPSRTKERLDKLGIDLAVLFEDYDTLWKRVIADKEVDLGAEKQKITAVFDSIAEKASAVDTTLVGFVKAEAQRQLAAIDNVSKKILKATKLREETKISQLEKIYQQLFPGGVWQERVENGLAFIAANGVSMIDEMIEKFDPLSNAVKIILPSSQGKTEE